MSLDKDTDVPPETRSKRLGMGRYLHDRRVLASSVIVSWRVFERLEHNATSTPN